VAGKGAGLSPPIPRKLPLPRGRFSPKFHAMGLWPQSWRRNRRATGVQPEERLLVISDVHLGEDVLSGSSEELAGRIRTLNRELAEFVAGHAAQGRGDTRWHLIINGDLFDFVRVSVQPDPEEAFEIWSREQPAKRRPLPNTAENVVYKLGRILEIHRPLFRELAGFLLVGNRLTIIEGNHDTEFYFEEVQITLRNFLIEEALKLHRRQARPTKLDADAIAQAVTFRRWFEASPGRYHIEHGHQYDEFSSFEYHLAPLDRDQATTLATPMSHRLMPYFAEILGDFTTHGIDKRGFVSWLKFWFSKGPWRSLVMAGLYLQAMWQLLSRAGRRRRVELRPLAEDHTARLAGLAQTSHYGFKTLDHLDRIKATPAEFSVLKMVHLFFLDRFLTGATSGVLLGVAIGLGELGGLILGACTAVTAALVFWGLARIGPTSVEERLRRSAAQIADQTGARYVVFGHSHHPELVDLAAAYGAGRYGESAFYVNSGSWVTRELLLGHEGRGMTYVEISGDGAMLKRWLGAGQAPELIAATGRSERTTSSEGGSPGVASKVEPSASS